MARTGKELVVGSDTTHVESSQQGSGREEQCDPSTSKPRGRSKEVIYGIDSRLAQVEEALNGMEAKMGDLGERVDGLEEEDATIHSSIREMLFHVEEAFKDQLAKVREDLMREIRGMQQAHDQEMTSLRASIEEMRGDVALCKRALAAGSSNNLGEARRIDVPKPKSFGGSRNAKEVDNFLWGLEQYFGAMGIYEEGAKVQFAALYLCDTAMLWWRRRRGDMEKGLCSISTFDDFKKELKRQFYPENAEDEARAKLRRLKHEGSMRDYIKDFTSLVLEIPDMSDKDSLFNFMDGLQPWAKTELRRRGAQDLATAIAVAESLVDYTKEFTEPREKRSTHVMGGGERQDKEESCHGKTSTQGKSKGKQDRSVPRNNCFLCGGPHWARECPQKSALNSLLASHQETGEAKAAEMEAHVGSLQLLNGMQSAAKPQARGLLFVEMEVGGKSTSGMVDTGASHNFISIEEAKRLGLRAVEGGGSIKVVNAVAKPIHGVARGVKTKVGAWSGMLNFTIIPMDDFKVVLGMDFFDEAKAFPMPFANNMCIMEGQQASMVPMTRVVKGASTLSAIQLGEGSWDKEEDQLPDLHHRDDEELEMHKDMPGEALEVLEAHKDILLAELPEEAIKVPEEAVEISPSELPGEQLSEEDQEIMLQLRDKPPVMGQQPMTSLSLATSHGRRSFASAKPRSKKRGQAQGMLRKSTEKVKDKGPRLRTWASKGMSKRTSTTVTTSWRIEVEEGMVHRKGASKDYLTKWKGLPDSEASKEHGDAP